MRTASTGGSSQAGTYSNFEVKISLVTLAAIHFHAESRAALRACSSSSFLRFSSSKVAISSAVRKKTRSP